MHSSSQGDSSVTVQESRLWVWAQHGRVPVFGAAQGLPPGSAGLEQGLEGSGHTDTETNGPSI